MTQVETHDAEYAQTLGEQQERFYAYIGDDQGFLKIWDLHYVIKQLQVVGIEKCKSMVKSNFNPRRQELVDCSAFSNQLRKQRQKDLPPGTEA